MKADLKMKRIVTFFITALLAGTQGKKLFFVTSFSVRISVLFQERTRTRGEKERKMTKLTITGACPGGYLNKVSQYQAKYYEKKMVSELSLSFWEPEKKVFSSELI